jgi:hypothetical protein
MGTLPGQPNLPTIVWQGLALQRCCRPANFHASTTACEPTLETARLVSVNIANELVKRDGTNGDESRLVERSDFQERGTLMMVFLIIATTAGILLGLRFKVFVLVPAVLIAASLVIITGHGLKMVALTILATTASLQIGYILGCVVRVYAAAYLPARTTPRYRLSRSEPA